MVGNEPPQEQNFPMWLGTEMEGIVIRAFTRETGLKCRRPHRKVDPNFWFTTEEYGFPMGALLDAWTMDPDQTGIEAKTASAWLAGDWEDDIPVQYMVQIQHQMACTGWSHFYAAAIVGNKFVCHRVPRDEELIALITDKERDFFWDHLVARVPPDPDGSESSSDAIKRLWPNSKAADPIPVLDDPEVERLAMVYQALGKQIKGLEKDRDEVGNRLRVVLENKERLISRSKQINWKTQEYDYFDLKAFRQQWGALADRYTTKKTKRPLTITEVKP
jgi:predicted phage-related endonuclease